MDYADYELDLELLGLLLHRTHDDIKRQAITNFIDTLEPAKREVFRAFKAEASKVQPEAPRQPESKYKLSDRAARNKKLNTSRGRILAELRKQLPFTRKTFEQAVALAYGWNPITRSFNTLTKFKTLKEAERAWWNMLKNRDGAVIEMPPNSDARS